MLVYAQYATDAGRQHFADQLTSIRYCVQEVRTLAPTLPARPSLRSPYTRSPRAQTCNFDALYAYLSATNYDFAYGDAHHRMQPTHALASAPERTPLAPSDRAKNLRPKRNIKTAMNNGETTSPHTQLRPLPALRPDLTFAAAACRDHALRDRPEGAARF